MIYIQTQHEIKTARFIKKKQFLVTNSGNFFLGGGVGGRFLKWSISSLARVQIAQELVRLIPWSVWTSFRPILHPRRPWKLFHARHFDGPSSKKENFWRFRLCPVGNERVRLCPVGNERVKDIYKQNYLLYALLKETWGNCAEEVCPSFVFP